MLTKAFVLVPQGPKPLVAVPCEQTYILWLICRLQETSMALAALPCKSYFLSPQG